jgi:hypothetical protein
MKKTNYKEWLKWREEYFGEKSSLSNERQMIAAVFELTEEQQMEAWGRYLEETDSGHRPC